ncbi:glycosyltransferase family 2 protein [Dysgonomonas sp.]
MGKSIDNPKVSVIIPVYNTGEYVEEAVCSIMNQTLSDLEIIIVNDGSTDNSLHIVTKLQSIDKRIIVRSQKNKGQSSTRNLGLSLARGEYIYFMDSDDILHKEALKICYKKCSLENLDFAFFDGESFTNSNISLPISYNRREKINTEIESGLQKINTLIDTRGYSASVCLLFIDRNYLNSLSLDFLPGIIHEDQLFTAKLFAQAQKVAYIPETFFYRRLRPGSIMTKQYTIVNVRNYFIVVNELIKFASGQNEDINKTIHKTIRFMFDPAIYMANKLKWKDRLSIAKTCFVSYKKYVSTKSWLVLLFPWLIKLKSYTK